MIRTKWQAFLPITETGKDLHIVCKAVDSSYQSQPDSFEGIYNVRGVLVNAWHQIHVKTGEN